MKFLKKWAHRALTALEDIGAIIFVLWLTVVMMIICLATMTKEERQHFWGKEDVDL